MDNNVLVPKPHRILNMLKHTKTECTFRVACDTEPGYGQFFMLSLPKVGEAVQKFGIADGLVLEPTYNDGFTAGELTDEMKAAIQAGYDALKSGEVSVQLAD